MLYKYKLKLIKKMAENYKVYSSLKSIFLKFIADEDELSDMNNTNKPKNVLEYKIIVIGDSLTGKTSFCNRFFRDEFDLEIKPSKETICYIKTVTLFDKKIKIYLLDVETHPLPIEEDEQIYKDVNGIIVLYDITNNESFEKIEKILIKAKNQCKLEKENSLPIIIVGNKNDLKFLRNINFSDAQNKANQLGCDLKEINCNKDPENVHNIIKYLVSKIYFNSLNEEEKEIIKNKAKQFRDNNNY